MKAEYIKNLFRRSDGGDKLADHRAYTTINLSPDLMKTIDSSEGAFLRALEAELAPQAEAKARDIWDGLTTKVAPPLCCDGSTVGQHYCVDCGTLMQSTKDPVNICDDERCEVEGAVCDLVNGPFRPSYVGELLRERGLEIAQGGPEYVVPLVTPGQINVRPEHLKSVYTEQEDPQQPDPMEDARKSIELYIKNHTPVPAVTDIKPEAGDGSRKDANKTSGYWLIPQAPLAELARLYATGAAKYSPRGWEAGMDYSRVIDALYRHVGKWLSGERYDAVDGQHHMAAVAWAAFAIMEYERTHPELDNIATSED